MKDIGGSTMEVPPESALMLNVRKGDLSPEFGFLLCSGGPLMCRDIQIGH